MDDDNFSFNTKDDREMSWSGSGQDLAVDIFATAVSSFKEHMIVHVAERRTKIRVTGLVEQANKPAKNRGNPDCPGIIFGVAFSLTGITGMLIEKGLYIIQVDGILKPNQKNLLAFLLVYF